MNEKYVSSFLPPWVDYPSIAHHSVRDVSNISSVATFVLFLAKEKAIMPLVEHYDDWNIHDGSHERPAYSRF